jgi:predicted lactoylglutathione lyase
VIRRFYLNLPVKDVARSRAFFAALGYQFDRQFSGEEAACLAITDTASVMLLPHAHYARFSAKPIADTANTSAGLISLWRDSRAEVDAELDAALKAGATAPRKPARRKTSASCTCAAIMTSTATAGASTGWTPPPACPQRVDTPTPPSPSW